MSADSATNAQPQPRILLFFGALMPGVLLTLAGRLPSDDVCDFLTVSRMQLPAT